MNFKLVIAILTLSGVLFSGAVMSQDNPDDSMQTVTGCLRKGAGTDSKIYTLLDENGKLWDLQSKTVSFGPHVGHMVTVSGTIPQKSKKPGDPDDTAPQNHLMVTKLEMVSESCQK